MLVSAFGSAIALILSVRVLTERNHNRLAHLVEECTLDALYIDLYGQFDRLLHDMMNQYERSSFKTVEMQNYDKCLEKCKTKNDSNRF